jgi:hypothetical protein
MVSDIEYEVDVRNLEYERQLGKASLTRIYQSTQGYRTIPDHCRCAR